jgi:hypothetical protein
MQTPLLQVLGNELGNSPHATLVVLMHKQSHACVVSTPILDPFFLGITIYHKPFCP